MKLHLNKEQKDAISYYEGPSLIMAGAGSGKTRVLTEKICNLIQENNVNPSSILGITFTTKAAHELSDRVDLSLDKHYNDRPFLGTFHSFAIHVLRQHFQVLGRSEKFRVYTKQDKQKLLTTILEKEHESQTVEYIHQISSYISVLKNELISSELAIESSNNKAELAIANIYKNYQSQLEIYNAIDFDDMLYYSVKILESFPDILQLYRDRYRYILVDEYQDTNVAQYRLIKALGLGHQNVTVVGDFDQTIYSWRGAKLQNLENFENDFENVKLFTLEQNYRSSKFILDASNALIQHNTQRRPKNLWTDKESGVPVQFNVFFDEKEESLFIYEQIMLLKKKHKLLNKDFAVLYRLNSQSQSLEDIFNKKKLPYSIVGGTSFFSRSEIKVVLAYLKVINDPHDNESLFVALKVPSKGIGSSTQSKLKTVSKKKKSSIKTLVADNSLGLTDHIHAVLESFFQKIAHCQSQYIQHNMCDLSGLVKYLLEDFGLMEYYRGESETTDKVRSILDCVDILESEGESLQDYLDFVAIKQAEQEERESIDAVNLMTLHHAKGMEFPVVFIIGFEDSLIPYFRSSADIQNIEEERRLVYVGMTRSQTYLYLTATNQRRIFGELYFHDISRFIVELPSQTFECSISERLYYSEATILKKLAEKVPFYGVLDSSDKQLHAEETCLKLMEGDIVKHGTWGKGVLEKIEGQGEEMLYQVKFKNKTKFVLAKYATFIKEDA